LFIFIPKKQTGRGSCRSRREICNADAAKWLRCYDELASLWTRGARENVSTAAGMWHKAALLTPDVSLTIRGQPAGTKAGLQA
jgi:hypothetical protein